MKSSEYKNQESKISPENTISRGDPSVYERIFNKKEIRTETDNLDMLRKKVTDEIKIAEIKKQAGIEKNPEQMKTFLSEITNQDGAIDFTHLDKIGKGGTHDVFVSHDNHSFVIKLNRGILNRITSSGKTSLSPEMRQGAERVVADENSKRDQLYQYFGEKNCLREKMLIQKIKSNGLQEAETPILLQESSDVFNNPDKKDFSASYAENGLTDETKESYERMNASLMGNGEFNEDDFLQFNDKLKPVFELIDNDENFKSSMQEFLLRFKEYFSASGNFIDLVGEENVLFYPKDGKWNFQIGSVLKDESMTNVEEALEMLENNPELLNTKQNEKEKNNLINGLALTRLFNAVGIKSGIGKIVDIQLSEKQSANLEKLKF